MRQRHADFFVFYAEQVWVHVPDLDALVTEDQLARLADIVIIVVESPGTFTELGAFMLSGERSHANGVSRRLVTADYV